MTQQNNTLHLGSLQKAVAALGQSIAVYNRLVKDNTPEDEKNTLRAGVIQSFEFTYELCWKFMKRWLDINVNPELTLGATRREFFRICAENKLIADVDEWMVFHEARNKTSHIYDLDVAEEVLACTFRFLPYAKAVLERLEQ